MNDLLQTGNAWLAGMMKDHAAHTVAYHRAAQSVNVAATVGQTTFDVETDHGVEQWEARDYLMLAADLVLGGVAVTPQRGDQIHETIGPLGTVEMFEVLSPGDEPEWRFSDADHLTLRIHTKHVGTVT